MSVKSLFFAYLLLNQIKNIKQKTDFYFQKISVKSNINLKKGVSKIAYAFLKSFLFFQNLILFLFYISTIFNILYTILIKLIS